MNKKEIGMRLQQLRNDRHLHQKEVATVLGISPSAYCDRENGHVMLSAVEMDKLAAFYEMGLDEFLRAGQPVLNMQDHASHGYNVIHSQTVTGASDDVMKRFIDVLDANAKAMEKLAEQQARMVELLSRKG